MPETVPITIVPSPADPFINDKINLWGVFGINEIPLYPPHVEVAAYSDPTVIDVPDTVPTIVLQTLPAS